MVRVENRLKCTWSEYLELMSGDWFDPPLVMRNFSLFIWNSQRNSNLTPDGAILNTTWRHSVEDLFSLLLFIYFFLPSSNSMITYIRRLNSTDILERNQTYSSYDWRKTWRTDPGTPSGQIHARHDTSWCVYDKDHMSALRTQNTSESDIGGFEVS